MKIDIDMAALLAPIAGDDPGGENLRYTPVYDAIKEARRADDPLDRGDWGRDVKTADWDQVLTLCTDALANRSKDPQIAVWLTEALINTTGFDGFIKGLSVVNSYLRDHWEHLYPKIEDGDLDYRAAPVEFMNDNCWVLVKQAGITDPDHPPVYNWMHWEESRKVGREEDTRNQYGDLDDEKKRVRDERIAGGMLTAETFDEAVAFSSRGHFETVSDQVQQCWEAFQTLDALVDEKFGLENAPRLAELRSALEDCQQLITRLLKQKKAAEPDPQPSPQPESENLPPAAETGAPPDGEAGDTGPDVDEEPGGSPQSPQLIDNPAPPPMPAATPMPATPPAESLQWATALKRLENGGMKPALKLLTDAANSAPSVRQTTRYRLLMAKLCLKAERPDLARPIAEQLHELAAELNLERWESPTWIAEMLDTLYQCLTTGEPSDDDLDRARDLFRRICTTDVTRAMPYK